MVNLVYHKKTQTIEQNNLVITESCSKPETHEEKVSPECDVSQHQRKTTLIKNIYQTKTTDGPHHQRQRDQPLVEMIECTNKIYRKHIRKL